VSSPFRRHEYDPTWYRVLYSRAAHALHLLDTDARARPPGVGKETERILTEFFGEAIGGVALPRPEIAVRDAQELVRVSNQALSHAGHRWAGRRRAWYAPLKPRRSPARDRDMAEFLESILEPAAVVLLLSARLRAEQLDVKLVSELVRSHGRVSVDREKGPRRPAEIRGELEPSNKAEEVDSWLGAYLRMLLMDDRERNEESRTRRVLARIGFTRWRRARPPSYRVRYNLACLLSRLTERVADVRDRDETDELGDAALEQLRLCFRALAPGPRRDRLARWAWQDPGLAGIRGNEPARFARIVGRRPHDRPARRAK